MSGTSALPPIQVRIDGAQAAQQAIDGLTQAADRMGAASTRTAGQVGVLKTQAEQAGGAFRNTGQIIGQAGYQVQDFAVQVASGQSALTAFIQQGSQLAGIFGPYGAMAGAALAIGGIAAQFLFMGESAEQAQRRAEVAFKGMTEHAQQVRDVLAEINSLFLSANQNATNAANQALARNREELTRLQSVAVQQMEGGEIELSAARRELATAETRSAAELNRRLQSTEGRLAFAQGRGDQFIAAYEEQSRQDLFRLRERVFGLEAFIARHGREAGDLGEALGRLRTFGTFDFDMPRPPTPPNDEGYGTGGGGGTRLPDADLQSGWLAVQDQSRDRDAAEREEARDWDREQERREREAERTQQRAIEANRRVTDNIVNYTADAFADMFDENGKGWEGMLETFETTFRRMLARIAAEAIIRPIVAPIVSSLGLGALGTGNGGFSGLFGGGATAGGTVAAGGGTGGLGQLQSVGSLFNFGGGGGIGGFVNNPIWQPGAGFFASQAAGTTAGLEALGAGVYGPAVPGGGSMLGTLGGVSLGTYAAGIGGGYMVGTTIGNMIARTPAQRTNAQIGAGGGAVAGAAAGAMIGSVIPVIGTAAGAVIGGLIGGGGGGALGGSIGPSSQFSGGDVGIGVGPDGLLRITGSGGKRWDAGAAEASTQQQLDQINAVLRAGGISIQGAGGFDWDRGSGGLTLGFAGSGGSNNVLGPTELFARVRGNLTATNDNMRTALQSSTVQSFQDIGNVAQWLASTYEPLSKAKDYTQDYADAIAAQNKVYDDAIARARELGLAEEGLAASRDKALSDVLDRRNTSVYSRERQLEIAQERLSGNSIGANAMEFSLNYGLGRKDLIDFLRNSGVGDETETFQRILGRYDNVTEIERARSDRAARDAAGGSFMQELTMGGLGGLAPNARYAAGLRVWQDARSSGDIDRITAAARSFLPVARDYLGTSERFGALSADVARTVSRLGGDPLGLSTFINGQSQANATLERIFGVQSMAAEEVKALRKEQQAMNATIQTLIGRLSARV